MDKQATDCSRTNFVEGTEVAHVEGTLTLNYVKVCCVADIKLSTLNGAGYLVILGEVQPYAAQQDKAI